MEVKFSKDLIDWITKYGNTKKVTQLGDCGEEEKVLIGTVNVGFGAVSNDIDNPGQYFKFDPNQSIMPSQLSTTVPIMEFDKKTGR